MSASVAAFVFWSAGVLAAQNPTQYLGTQEKQTRWKIVELAQRFDEVLAATPLESQLRARCRSNCAEVVDTQHHLTVAQKLQNIEVTRQAKQARIRSQIQSAVNEYVVHSVDTKQRDFGRIALSKNLSHILAGVANQPPATFLLASGQNRALLIFDILGGAKEIGSSYAVLTGFNADGPQLALSDSTGADMNGHVNIDVKELHSPVEGKIWLLVSGYGEGANGPNCRMRVFAYEGKKFRTVWAPADIWATLTTQVTERGFVVRGDLYRSDRHLDDHYSLATNGPYRMTKGTYLSPRDN